MSFLTCLAVLSLASPGARERAVHIPNGSRPELDGNFGLPDQPERVPCVVFAPGKGASKDTPLIKELGSALRSENIATLRFDWAFYSAKANPSEGLLGEATDLRSALTFVRRDPKIDTSRILLVGKSLGSVVSYRVFRADREVMGAVLLTPIALPAEPGKYYPDLAAETRPMLFTVGASDVDNCPLDAFHRLLAGAGTQIAAQVFPGDHSFTLRQDDSLEAEKENSANRATVVKGVVSMVRQWLAASRRK